MRKILIRELEKLLVHPDFCLLTGDLGFMVLEPLQQQLGDRFINAGIAEQNMISVAAGMAKSGFRPWVYSIAPFVYARPFEQVRNDIALHNLPVRLLGNGAGYGYGVQGATHHAIEDIAVMRCLQNMEVYAPCFGSDFEGLIQYLAVSPHPAYIRLGYDFLPKEVTPPPFSKFRRVLDGTCGTVFALGSMAGVVYSVLSELAPEKRPALCACATVPARLEELPEEILTLLNRRLPVLTVEEHVRAGGLGEAIAGLLCEAGLPPAQMVMRTACGYPGKRYGSQRFFWQLSRLDPESLLQTIQQLFKQEVL